MEIEPNIVEIKVTLSFGQELEIDLTATFCRSIYLLDNIKFWLSEVI